MQEEKTYTKALPCLKKLFQKKVQGMIGDKKGKEAAAIWKDQRGILNNHIDETLDKADVEFSSGYTAKMGTLAKCGQSGQRR